MPQYSHIFSTFGPILFPLRMGHTYIFPYLYNYYGHPNKFIPEDLFYFSFPNILLLFFNSSHFDMDGFICFWEDSCQMTPLQYFVSLHSGLGFWFFSPFYFDLCMCFGFFFFPYLSLWIGLGGMSVWLAWQEISWHFINCVTGRISWLQHSASLILLFKEVPAQLISHWKKD